MEVKPVLRALYLLLILFTTVSGVSSGSERPIVYTRDQLLAFRSMAMLTGNRPVVPRELRRRRRGRCAVPGQSCEPRGDDTDLSFHLSPWGMLDLSRTIWMRSRR